MTIIGSHPQWCLEPSDPSMPRGSRTNTRGLESVRASLLRMARKLPPCLDQQDRPPTPSAAGRRTG